MTANLFVAIIWIASCTAVGAAAVFVGPGAATMFAGAVLGCCGAAIHVIFRLSGRRLRWRYAGVPVAACTIAVPALAFGGDFLEPGLIAVLFPIFAYAVFPLARRSVREPGDIV